MRIDQARIAIRERAWVDNLDLALQVVRAHASGVLTAALVGVLPMIAINFAIVNSLYGSQLAEDTAFDAIMLATLLVMIEAPLATAPLTLYLGQALFVERPKPRQIARDFAACLPQLMLYQVILRIVLIVPIMTWIVPYALWPYLNEVILLERNPLVGKNGQMSTMKRNALLHRGGSGDFLARSLGAALLAVLLMIALVATKKVLLDALFGFEEGWTMEVLSFQCVLWIVAVYFTVVRFLNYLDQRIRGEGWEVELSMRAQREKLMRHTL